MPEPHLEPDASPAIEAIERTPPTAPPPPSPDAVPVLLSPGLVELAPAMAQALGPKFIVQTAGPGERGVMVVGPLGAAGIAFLRANHRGVRLLVVDRRWSSSQPGEAVVHLEAGADGYLSSPLVAEVASHVKALARRCGGDAWPREIIPELADGPGGAGCAGPTPSRCRQLTP